MRTPHFTAAHLETDRSYRLTIEGMTTETAFHLASVLGRHPVFAPVAEALINQIMLADYDADAVALQDAAGEDDQSPEVAA